MPGCVPMGEMKLEVQGNGVGEEKVEARARAVCGEGNGMNFVCEKVRIRVDEDRISSLPDEIIHRILSFNDTKYAVQTSVLSSRWKFVWKFLPYLNFSTYEFRILPKFSKFVNRVLSFRNNMTEVSSLDFYFRRAVSQTFVEKIASYAMSHNVQKVEIFVSRSHPKGDHKLPLCLFSSESLKHLKIKSITCYPDAFPLPQFPWNFPALTTLCLEDVWLCDANTKSLDLFSKCVNLKNLTLKDCGARSLNFLTIATPRLENLSITSWRITRFMVSAPDLSSFYYGGPYIPSLFAGSLQLLDKVTLQLTIDIPKSMEEKQKQAKKLFTLFEELRNAKFLTLHSCIIELLAAVPDLLETQNSPFSNLKCLEVQGFEKQKTTSSDSANPVINYLLNSSPAATVRILLPQEQPKKTSKKVKVGDSKVDFKKQLDAVYKRIKADAEALVEGQLKEREAQLESHKAETDAFLEHIKVETLDFRNNISSQTISMAKTFQAKPLMGSNSTTAEQEKTIKDVEAQMEMDGTAIYMRLKEEMEALSERQWAEREALLLCQNSERIDRWDRVKAELDVWTAVLKARNAELEEKK